MGQIKRSIGNQCWSPEDWGTMRLKAGTFKLLLHYYCCHYCFVTIQLLVRCQLEDIFLNHLFLIVLYQTPHAFFDCLFFSGKYKQIFPNAAKPLANIPAK